MRSSARTQMLFALIAIPLQTPEGWHEIKFSELARSTVHFSSGGLEIAVHESASPLVYILPEIAHITAVHLEGRWKGLPHLPAGKEEGTDGADDYPLRLGMVAAGERSLAWIERLVAPEWIRQLADLAPNRRLQKVVFLNLAQRQAVGTRPKRARSKYIEEEVAWRIAGDGPLQLDHRFAKPLPVFGIWLQPDGDDTHSSFSLNLTKLQLESAP